MSFFTVEVHELFLVVISLGTFLLNIVASLGHSDPRKINGKNVSVPEYSNLSNSYMQP